MVCFPCFFKDFQSYIPFRIDRFTFLYRHGCDMTSFSERLLLVWFTLKDPYSRLLFTYGRIDSRFVTSHVCQNVLSRYTDRNVKLHNQYNTSVASSQNINSSQAHNIKTYSTGKNNDNMFRLQPVLKLFEVEYFQKILHLNLPKIIICKKKNNVKLDYYL